MTATQTATIQVAYVNPPEAGKNKGTIKTSTGEYLGVWANQIGLFRPGSAYEVDYSERQWNGRTYKTVTKVRPQERPQVVQQEGGGGPAPQPSTISAAEFQFVTRVLCARISCCAVGGTHADILNEVRALRHVYREGMG